METTKIVTTIIEMSNDEIHEALRAYLYDNRILNNNDVKKAEFFYTSHKSYDIPLTEVKKMQVKVVTQIGEQDEEETHMHSIRSKGD